jgi:hypothetical protein
MNILSEFLARELQGLGNLWAYLFFAIIATATYLFFGVIYIIQGVGINLQAQFWKKLLWYWLWAFAQQSIIFVVLYFVPLNDDWLYACGVFLFSIVFHFPNLRLMLFTFAFAGMYYYAYFYAGFTSLLMVSLAHAFGGTLYYSLGYDMRVWRFK